MQAIGKLLEASLQHYEKKEYAAAEKLLDELLAANPNFHRAWFMKGIILEETGRQSEADQYLAKAGSVFTLMFRLAMQLEEIDPERSLSYYNRLVEMDPANNLIWFNRGLLCEKTGNTTEARASFRNLRPMREIASRILIPLGFMVIMIAGGLAMVQRGDRALGSIVLSSAIFCFFWLKRDAGKALQMVSKKKKSA